MTVRKPICNYSGELRELADVDSLPGGGAFTPTGIATVSMDVGAFQAGMVLLLHMEGANGGTVFTDELGHTVTRYAIAVTSTADKVFGESSYYSYHTAGVLNVAAASDLVIGSRDFWCSVWVRPDGTTPSFPQYIFDFRDFATYSGGPFAYLATTTNMLTFGMDTSYLGGTLSVPAGQWSHLFFARVNGVMTAYVGNQLAGTGEAGQYAWNNTAVISGYADAMQGSLIGFMDEFAFGIGAAPAKYVPSQAYSRAAEDTTVTKFVSAAWVTATTKLIPTFDASCSEEAAALHLAVSCSNIVAGVGFDVTITAPEGAAGTYTVNILGV